MCTNNRFIHNFNVCSSTIAWRGDLTPTGMDTMVVRWWVGVYKIPLSGNALSGWVVLNYLH